ncbi:mammalian cell entry protein [Mycolicibacterium aromaticivorans JS19b1 = JCM 16368]|uniref:Mammalian cell entry protein n=2 Tax=Mycolicibacterium aromaticivorans TaxID=318425 RepID=A0A064CD67_9MYCO|nr:MlaD family protein [Mycolicibacterium aromaticivorans]KDE98255.1 mammalian cell entry protein [Mycolicibacterium aromaticivorans JS19b1 = JCM 16368]
MSAIRAPRLARTALATVVAAMMITVGSSCSPASRESAVSYCAIMPDTIGLYVGNPVTQMGYPIGTVTAISAGNTNVRVVFSVTERRQLPADVKAVIRSPSILADRSLELVGNYSGGPQLTPGGCVPLERSVSPKTVSEVIGSANTFLAAINPDGSTNIKDTVQGLDRLTHNNGAAAGRLLTTTSALLDSPDQSISDIGSIVENLSELTTAVKEMSGPLKQALLDARTTTPDLAKAVDGASRLAGGPYELGTLNPLIETVAVLETRLGDTTQLTLDTAGATLRKLSPHANAFAGLFDPVPWWINNLANHYNAHQFSFFNIAYRPPMFRVPTHDGQALCGAMNSAMPGSCADVNGQPYAVDVSLLQYVLMQASHH